MHFTSTEEDLVVYICVCFAGRRILFIYLMFCLIYSPFSYNGNFGYGLFIYDITFIGRGGRGIEGGGGGWGSHYTPLLIKRACVQSHRSSSVTSDLYSHEQKKEKGIGFSRQRGLRLTDFSCRLPRTPPPQLLPELNSASLRTLEKSAHVQTISLHGSLWMRTTRRHWRARTHKRGRVNSRPVAGTHTQHSLFDLRIHTGVHC